MSKTNLLVSCLALSAILIGITALTAPAAIVTFNDSTFNDADWTAQTMYQTGNGGSLDVNTQVATGGHDGGEYRLIQQSVNAHNGVNPSCFWTFYQYGNGTTTGVFNPATQGAILTMDYSAWAINLTLGTPDGFGVGPALMQNGNIYAGYLLISPETVWTQKVRSDLTAADFMFLSDPTLHPDFSAAGAPIAVGFFRSDSGNANGNAFTVEGGIDDWSLTITTAVAPEPASVTLLILGGLALARGRRNRRSMPATPRYSRN
jgi:hypothetical protein